MPAIVAAGLVVGARSARRWITIAVLTTGLIVCGGRGSRLRALQSGFMDG